MKKQMFDFDVKFDIYEDGKCVEKDVSAMEYFGGEVLAEDDELAKLTVQEWLSEEVDEERHDVQITKKSVFVDGILNFSNFRVEELAA